MEHSNLWVFIRSALAAWKHHIFSTTEPPPDAWVQALRETDLFAITSLIPAPSRFVYTPCDLVLAVALIALGPRDDGDPPDHQWDTLRQIVRAEVSHPAPEYWLEVVIAWGCGWRRTAQPRADTWDGEWEYAVFALCSMVMGSVRTTIKHLARVLANKYQEHTVMHLLRVPDSTTQLAQLLPTGDAPGPLTAAGELGLYASQMTLELLDSPEEHATSGTDAHPPSHAAHRLASWQPADRTLRVFVAEAVRGSASKELKTNAFRSSMLYPLLQEDLGIHVYFAEFKFCHADTCDGALIHHSVTTGTPLKITDSRHGVYEGDRCPICATPAVHGRTYMIARRNWLIVPHDYGGTYEMQARWHCTFCGTLFPISPSYMQRKAQIQEIEQYTRQLRDPEAAPRTLQALAAEYAPDEPLDLATAQRELRAAYQKTQAILQELKAASSCPLCQRGTPSQRPTYLWVSRCQ